VGMLIQHLYQPFEIEFVEVNECPMSQHRHTFFELIYIFKGTGVQNVNQHTLEYYPENLFLVMPQDIHFFKVRSTTSYLFIRFNDIYLEAQRVKANHGNLGDWIQKMEYIFQNNTHMAGCIIRDLNDKPLVRALMDAILREYINQKTFHREMVQQLINTLITIVARNISMDLPEKNADSSPVSLDIVNYIHQNIYSPEQLKAAQIAAHFSISQNYISEYFKKQTGENLQTYIANYKVKLVETRLQYSDMRMNEIVTEMGFTDESHLNRTFKKYKGVSPSAFRKQARLNAHPQPEQAI
jgi:AraC-like DNA-binding protein